MANWRKNKVLMAVMVRNQEGLEKALADGRDVNMLGPSSMTPLHLAVLDAQEKLVETLLAAGANLELRDKNDLTPLGYAVLPIIETPLPQHKKDLKTPEGQALLNASRARIRKQLLAAGANWHIVSKKAPSPWERFEHYWPDLAQEMGRPAA